MGCDRRIVTLFCPVHNPLHGTSNQRHESAEATSLSRQATMDPSAPSVSLSHYCAGFLILLLIKVEGRTRRQDTQRLLFRGSWCSKDGETASYSWISCRDCWSQVPHTPLQHRLQLPQHLHSLQPSSLISAPASKASRPRLLTKPGQKKLLT